MRGKEKIFYIVLACISVLVISFLVVGICKKNQDLTKAKDTISQNETDIKEKKDKSWGLLDLPVTLRSGCWVLLKTLLCVHL